MNSRPKHVGEGLVCDERGVVTPPRIVIDHHHAGHAVIPMNDEKRPLVDEWKPYQERQPTILEVREWVLERGKSIAGWARVTGARAGIIVIDFDGDAAERLHEWGLTPHVMTGSGGYHLIVRHPGWPVKTCNSKSSKVHHEHYPNIDIRGDGGYSLIAGFESRGGYTWLRDWEDVDELDVLPEAFRRFFGLWEAPTEEEPAPRPAREVPRIRSEVGAEGPSSTHLVERALAEATLSGRNNGGHWLAQQLHDHGYEEAEILETGKRYVAACPNTNLKGEPEPYTIEDFKRTMRQVLARPRRGAWGKGEVSLLADFGEAVNAADQEEDARAAAREIDIYFVPTEAGSKRRYPAWAIQDVVRLGCRVIIYGISGGGKSYALVDLARAAVTGGTWLGRQVRAGSVLYIAAEDPIGIHHRVEIAIQHAGVPRLHRVRVFEQSFPMTSAADVENFCRAMDYLDEKPAYVIIDNLSLCMGDGDPNEGKDAKRFVDGCAILQNYRWRAEDPSVDRDAEQPITVIIVHHTNKSGNFNGSQYFQNFVDAMSELTWDRRSDIRTIYAVKQRHGGHHRPLSYDLVEVEPRDRLCVVRSRVMPDATNDAEHTVSKLKPQELTIIRTLYLAAQERRLTMLESEVTPPEGLTRGEITLRSRVNARVVTRIINMLKGAGIVETVMVENENGKLVNSNKPEYLKLTVEGYRVAQSIPDEGFAIDPRDTDL